MLTRCPTCHTTFRVSADQLKARQGRVRCGQCQAVFNALETLVEETPPAAPAPSESVVIQGFDVPTINDSPGIPSFVVHESSAAGAPMAPTAAAAPVVEPAGEEVAEPDIEYVEIGELKTDGDDEPLDASISTDDFDDFVEPDIDFDKMREPIVADDIKAGGSAAADQSPDDQFTKTVVGFTWYVEPEPESAPEAAEKPATDEFTKTVIAPWRMATPETAPAVAEASAVSDLADTVIEPMSVAEPEAASAPAASAGADDMAKTVIESVRIAEAEFATRPTEEPVTDEFARTVIQSVRFVEPEPAPEPIEEPETDEFAKTVIESVGIAEPELELEPIEEPVTDEFQRTVVQPRRVAELEAASAGVHHPLHAFDFPMIEPLTLEGPGAAPAPGKETTVDEFTKTVVASARVVEPVTEEEFTELAFDLAPIDDIHVEEVPETPSILDASAGPPTSFPVLEPMSELGEHPVHEPANAILQELAATTDARGKPIRPPPAWPAAVVGATTEPETEPEPPTEPPIELEPTAEAALSGEPTADLEAEAAPGPEAAAILELQELPTRRRWPWILGGIVAVCLLAGQAIVHYRVELSVMMPPSKPALMAMCDLLDCKLPLPSQIDLIGIETSDLSPGPEGAGHLQLAATLRNRAPFGQTWPHLELTLTDSADKALVRRTLGPADYLPPARKAEDGFPARSEQAVHLDLKAPGVPAVGYRLYVFYP